jgi:uncharacterized protein YecA (UPF0149 family)
MENKINTGMIMDSVVVANETATKSEALESAITNNQTKKLEELAKAYRISHTPLVRENKKIGRNEPCPCGSGKKYKNCCLKLGKYEKLIRKA